MTDREILDQLLRAEELVIEAAQIVQNVRVESQKRDNAVHALKRRNNSDCGEIFLALFRLVEPNTIDNPSEITVESVRGDFAPRGSLSSFRLRYEVVCGIRKHAGGNSFRYPFVKKEEE